MIEAVPEKMEIKHAVFAELDAATPGHAILASNTSGLSITEIGDATNRPDKVVGFHFFWPASYMRLIEVDRGRGDLARDRPGRRQLRPGDQEDAGALRRVPGLRRQPHPHVHAPARSGATRTRPGIDVEEIDAFITEKAQMPMGPFRLADMSGLDTVVKVARDMREAYGDRFYVHRGMEERVERGDLGAKTGKGFYEHA